MLREGPRLRDNPAMTTRPAATPRALILYWGLAAIAAAATVPALCGATTLAFALAALSGLCLLALARLVTGSYTNLTFLFTAFFLLYGLSGPAHVLAGGTLHWLFPPPYHLGLFFEAHLLATVGLGGGLVVAAMALGTRRDQARQPAFAAPPAPSASSGLAPDPGSLMGLATGLAVAAFIMELVNAARVGGPATLLRGKAIYESAVSASTFHLPSWVFASLAIGLAALALATTATTRNGSFRRQALSRPLLTFALAVAPIVGMAALIGLREKLIAWGMIAVVGATYLRPVRRADRALIAAVFAVYFAIGLVHGNRAAFLDTLASGQWEAFARRAVSSRQLVKALSPGTNEFGVTFGNFNEYVKSGATAPRWGVTYLRAAAAPVPRILWPGDKPRGTMYEFRQEHFPQEISRGAIAGTAYSSLLEAYTNFGHAGALLVYALVGAVLALLEKARATIRSTWFALLYLMLLTFAQSFHRSSFDFVFDAVLRSWVAVAMVALIWRAARTVSMWRAGARKGRSGTGVFEAEAEAKAPGT